MAQSICEFKAENFADASIVTRNVVKEQLEAKRIAGLESSQEHGIMNSPAGNTCGEHWNNSAMSKLYVGDWLMTATSLIRAKHSGDTPH